MATQVVDGEAMLKIRRQWEREVLPKVDADRAVYDRVRAFFQAVSTGTVVDGSAAAPSPGTKKRDYAETRRAWCEAYYRGLGFGVTVPLPKFSNRVWTRETDRGRVVVPRAPTRLISYEAYMEAVGQGSHWTVKDEAERKKIVWEPTDEWYWFWADAQDTCPRLGRSWNDLTVKLRLLALEEYAPLWHMVKADEGRMLDTCTWCWLRTRFGSGALHADVYGGGVRVFGDSAERLAFPDGHEGGRVLDVV